LKYETSHSAPHLSLPTERRGFQRLQYAVGKPRTFMVNERFQVAKRCNYAIGRIPPSDQCRPGRI
jgi:hypothetical protein